MFASWRGFLEKLDKAEKSFIDFKKVGDSDKVEKLSDETNKAKQLKIEIENNMIKTIEFFQKTYKHKHEELINNIRILFNIINLEVHFDIIMFRNIKP